VRELTEPFSSRLGGTTGLAPYEGKVERHLSDLRGCFLNSDLVEQMLSEGKNPKIYEVYEIPQEPNTGLLSIGATVIYPGKIGDEYYFTKGHFHQKEPRAEIYIGIEGEGRILIQNRSGESTYFQIKPNVLVYIPPQSAHRSINTGSNRLVFLAIYPSDAGHDYKGIEDRGFAKIVVEKDGNPVIEDNPKYIKTS